MAHLTTPLGVPATPASAIAISTRMDVASIAIALEQNFCELQSLYALAAGGTVVDLGNVQVNASGLGSDLLNTVNAARLAPTLVNSRIGEVRTLFAALGRDFLWLVGPASRPRDLSERLVAAGLRERSNLPGMALDIATMIDEPVTERDFQVRPVESASELDAWLDVCRVAFPFDEATSADWARAHRPLGWSDESPLHSYIGWRDHQAVSCSAVFYAAGVASVQNVGTVESERGRGFARGTTLAALRDARSRGYRIAVLGSSDSGLPVYQRIGFRELFRYRKFGP